MAKAQKKLQNYLVLNKYISSLFGFEDIEDFRRLLKPVQEGLDQHKKLYFTEALQTLKINDELRQNGNTKDLIFDIPAIISDITAGITLYPGDIILTGTPAGVGAGFNPPKYLKPGDRVDCVIEGLGTLSNTIN